MVELKINSQDSVSTARTLAQALPYIQRYDGSTIVIKLGGHAMTNDTAMANFAQDVVLMKQCNVNPIIVHGGGPAINTFLKKVNIKSNFINGKRVTDKESMPIIEMVLSGSVNKNIVSAINNQGGKAIGLSGKDALLAKTKKFKKKKATGEVEKILDLGFVGLPSKINTDLLKWCIQTDFIPVISPIGYGEKFETYNINADTMSGAISASILSERLILLTDVKGVLDKKGNLLTQIKISEVEKLISNGTISEGMIPKVETCVEAVKNGVKAAVILDGRLEHSILLEIFTEHGVGTLITN